MSYLLIETKTWKSIETQEFVLQLGLLVLIL